MSKKKIFSCLIGVVLLLTVCLASGAFAGNDTITLTEVGQVSIESDDTVKITFDSGVTPDHLHFSNETDTISYGDIPTTTPDVANVGDADKPQLTVTKGEDGSVFVKTSSNVDTGIEIKIYNTAHDSEETTAATFTIDSSDKYIDSEAALEEVQKEASSTEGKAKLTGVTTDMQYKANPSGAWTDITSVQTDAETGKNYIEVDSADTYQVRWKSCIGVDAIDSTNIVYLCGYANGETIGEYGVTVAGKALSSAYTQSNPLDLSTISGNSGTAWYDVSTNTLHLKNATITTTQDDGQAIRVNSSFTTSMTIQIDGNSTIAPSTAKTSGNNILTATGIYAEGVNLTIAGSNLNMTIPTGAQLLGIDCKGADLTIQNDTSITLANTTGTAKGIVCDDAVIGGTGSLDITMKGSTTGTATDVGMDLDSLTINQYGTVDITIGESNEVTYVDDAIGIRSDVENNAEEERTDTISVSENAILLVTLNEMKSETGILMDSSGQVISKGLIDISCEGTSSDDAIGVCTSLITCNDGSISVEVGSAAGATANSVAYKTYKSSGATETVKIVTDSNCDDLLLKANNFAVYEDGVTSTISGIITTSLKVYGTKDGTTSDITSKLSTENLYGYTALEIKNPAVTKVTVSGDSSIPQGSYASYSATVEGTATDTSVTWSIKENADNSSRGIAIVDSNGKVTVSSTATVGSTFTVRATSNANPSVYGDKTVTVTTAIADITLTKKSGDASFTSLSGTKLLEVTVSPNTDYVKSQIVWSLVNGNGVCVINKTGDNTSEAVSPVKVGTETVRAAIGSKYVDFTVTVTNDSFAITYPSVNNSLIWYYDNKTSSGFYVKTNIPKTTIKKVTVGELDATSYCTLTTESDGTKVEVPYTWLHSNIPSKTVKYYVKVYYGTGTNDYVSKLLYARSVKDAPITGDQDMGIYTELLILSAVTGLTTAGYVVSKKKRRSGNR